MKAARTFQTLALTCGVVTLILHVLEFSAQIGRTQLLISGLGGIAACVLLFIVTAPVCRDCKMQIWTVFARTHVCCFMEKTEIKNSCIRSLRFVGWLFLATGVLTMLQPRFEKGYRVFAQVVDQRLSSPEVLAARAELAAAQARLAAAPNSPQAALDLVYLLTRGRRFDQAHALLDEALAKAPTNPDLLAQRAILLGIQGRHPEEVEAWRKLLELREKDVEAHHSLGLALRDSGDLKGAEASLRQAVGLAVQDLRRFKQLYKITPQNVGSLGENLKAQLEGLKFRAGVTAYHLALVAGMLGDPEKEKHLRLARYLGFETSGFDGDLARRMN